MWCVVRAAAILSQRTVAVECLTTAAGTAVCFGVKGLKQSPPRWHIPHCLINTYDAECFRKYRWVQTLGYNPANNSRSVRPELGEGLRRTAADCSHECSLRLWLKPDTEGTTTAGGLRRQPPGNT